MKNILLYVGLIFYMQTMVSQEIVMALWPEGKLPNHVVSAEKEIREKGPILKISKVQEPTIEVYLPAKRNATGQAMLIFPGGGYGILAYDWEGTDIAKFLNGKGIAGIVVKYRLPSSISQTEQYNVPLIDAQRAMRLVRSKAEEFAINRNSIGIIGFSAGGHLASTLGTQFNENVYEDIDKIDALSARPDYMALVYPVISMGQVTHQGSKLNLLGDDPNLELVNRYSSEKRVNEGTPPTILIHATDDVGVPVENSLLFYQSLKDKSIPATMHIYPRGGHGFSLATQDVYLRNWTERLLEWIDGLGE